MEYIVSIDIGSSKIVVLVAQKQDTGIELVGTGLVESSGIKKGLVVNIQSALAVIEKAIIEAETISKIGLKAAIIGLSGTSMCGMNSTGQVKIHYQVINNHDIARVLQNAEAITLPANQEIIYTTPRSYTIDDNTQADDPIGMHGEILTAQVHLIISDKSNLKNITKSINQAGINVTSIMPNIIACANASLSEDEKRTGVCVADIGAGTTDIAIFFDGKIYHSEIIDNAAYEVTTDIMHAFSMNEEKAEEIKIQHGCALAEMVSSDANIDIRHIGDDAVRKLSLHTLAEVIEARYEDIFSEIAMALKNNNCKNKISTLVLTGGGANIKGCSRLAERYFSKPARIGNSYGINGADNISNNPSYAVAIGLLLPNENVKYQQKEALFFTKVKKFFQMLTK